MGQGWRQVLTRMAANPSVIVIAGPNGAGKTTAAPIVLRDSLGISEFVNADQIATGLPGFNPQGAAFGAGRFMLMRLHELAVQRESFAFETTLASRSFAPFIRKLKKRSYKFHLIFLWLANVELAKARVASRVFLTKSSNVATEEESRISLVFIRVSRTNGICTTIVATSHPDSLHTAKEKGCFVLRPRPRKLGILLSKTSMPSRKPVDTVELAFRQVKPIHDALKKAAKLAKREHDVRRSARNRLLALGRKARVGEVIEPTGERWNAERNRS